MLRTVLEIGNREVFKDSPCSPEAYSFLGVDGYTHQ